MHVDPLGHIKSSSCSLLWLERTHIEENAAKGIEEGSHQRRAKFVPGLRLRSLLLFSELCLLTLDE